jgi:hypothetical protein
LEEKTILSIPAMPLAIMLGVMGAVIGLVIGIFYALMFGALMSAYPSSGVAYPGWFAVVFGVGAIIVMPILGFIGGFIEGGVLAILYNFLAPRIGGVRLRFNEGPVPQPQTSVPPQ